MDVVTPRLKTATCKNVRFSPNIFVWKISFNRRPQLSINNYPPEAPCSIPLHENKFGLLAFLSKTSQMIDTNMSRSYILQQRRIHPGVQMSRTIWNKFPNTIKQADNLISSKYEFHWTMLNQHSIFQNSKKIFYLFKWWLLGQIHENVGISISRNHLKRFQ